MKKWILLILLLPSVMAATQIQYSEDNLTWTNVTSVNEDTNEGYQLNLQQDTLYFFRGRTDAGDWVNVSQRTRDTAEVDDYYLYITIFSIFIILLSLYYFLNDSVFGVISGMLIITTAVSIFNIGFPNLTNELLKNGLVTVLWGVGAYYITIPSLEIITSWGYEE